MLTIVCWKWNSLNPYRSTFKAQYVNIFANMIKRNLRIPHRILCITDDPRGVEVETFPLWENPVPHYGNVHRPNCYVRLKAFQKAFENIAGPRFVSMDLDCVVTDDITDLFDHDDDFRIWGNTHDINPYNGSMWQMNCGAREHVFNDFHPERSPALAAQKGFFGSDQAWMCYALGEGEKRWTIEDGVYSYRNHIRKVGGALPGNAKLVFFHGQHNPWDEEMQHLPWIRDHYK